MVEASAGKSAKFVSHFTRNCQSTGLIKCIVPFYPAFLLRALNLPPPRLRPPVVPLHTVFVLPEIAPKVNHHKAAEADHGHDAAELHDPGDDQAVFIQLGVVAIAVSQNVVDRRADLVMRGLQEAKWK